MYSTQTKAYTETSVITLALAISRGNWSFVNRFYILLSRDSFPNVTMQLLVAASPHLDPKEPDHFRQVLLCASAREVIVTFVIGGDLF